MTTSSSTEAQTGLAIPRQRSGDDDAGPLDRDAVGIVAGAEVAVVATADRYGERHVSVLAGGACFVRVLDARRLAWPDEGAEPRTADRANLAENPELAVLLVRPHGERGDARALHLNGRAAVVPAAELRAEHPDLPTEPVPGRGSDVWVVVEVGDAYVLAGDEVPPLATVGRPVAPAPSPDRDRRSMVLVALAIALVAACVSIALLLDRAPAAPVAAPPPAPAQPAGPATLFGRVTGVVDPATVDVDVDGRPVRVGVIGLDAATVPACQTQASLAFARRTLQGQTVTLVPDPTLPASPTPRAYLVLESQLSYTDAAIGAGQAPAAGASRYRAAFDREQRDARADGVGMWGPPCTS